MNNLVFVCLLLVPLVALSVSYLYGQDQAVKACMSDGELIVRNTSYICNFEIKEEANE